MTQTNNWEMPSNFEPQQTLLLNDKMLMPEEERQELIAALKKKWEELHHKFQKESIHSKLDTLGKKNRKEN